MKRAALVVGALLAAVFCASALACRQRPAMQAGSGAPGGESGFAGKAITNGQPTPTTAPGEDAVTRIAPKNSSAITPVPTATPAPTPFSMVWLSDTQYYPGNRPETLSAMLAWTARERDARNIVCVLHTGDLLQSPNSHTQQTRLMEAFAQLPPGLPVYSVAGNHDQSKSKSKNALYETYRPDNRLEDDVVSQDGACRYTLFEAGGVPMILVRVSFGGETDNLDWIYNAFAAYPDRYGILMLHSYMQELVEQYQKNRFDGDWALFERVVARAPNVRLVLSGHVYGQMYWQTTLDDGKGENPRSVQQILFNPQEEPHGGDGYLALLTFSPADKTLTCTGYSPLLDAFGPEKSGIPAHALPFELPKQNP